MRKVLNLKLYKIYIKIINLFEIYLDLLRSD